MNQFCSLTLKSLICVGLMVGSLLNAKEDGEKERVPCRVRQIFGGDCLTRDAKDLQDGSKLVGEISRDGSEEVGEEAQNDEDIQGACRAMEEIVGDESEATTEENQNDQEEGEEKVSNAASYYTSHEGAYHSLYAKTVIGDLVEIEDGSQWLVKLSDRPKIANWLVNDILVITRNRSWFSSYSYCLHNINTGAFVHINLFQTPFYNGTYTRWIKDIDYLQNQIFLNDGSVWDISSFDHNLLEKWMVNDTVIIGINDGIFSVFSPNLLINVTTNPLSHVSGKCVY